MDLHGKTAIVTGASSGIGAATVRQLREAGVRVAAGARRVERLDADVSLQLDVTDEESARVFVEQAVTELGGGVDILFNNAGLALGRYPFTESTLEDEQTVLHTNVDGVLRMTRLTLPHIRDLVVHGPTRTTGLSDTASRRKIFTCRPTSAAEERPCARTIVGTFVPGW